MKIAPLQLFFLFSILTSCVEKSLPSLEIVKETEFSWSDKEQCHVVYVNDDSTQKISARIKLRGGMSSRYEKHSYSLELDTKFALGNLPMDDDWIVNANYIDKTFMRHKISYDLFTQMAAMNRAPKSAYINLSVNGEYAGLYVLMQKINANTLGLDKTDSLAMLFKDPPVFYKDKLDNVQDSLNYYQQKFPKIRKQDKTDYIEQFKSFLFYSDDDLFSKEIQQWVDIENIIDWHILLLFSNNGDGIMKNFYLYKMDAKTPFRIGIWDYDHSFGRDGDNELNWGEKELNWERCILLKRLAEVQNLAYTQQLKKRWFELRSQNIITLENFKAHIEKNNTIIRKEVDRNFDRWPVDNAWYFDNQNYLQEIQLMIDFVEKRLPKLDSYINSL